MIPSDLCKYSALKTYSDLCILLICQSIVIRLGEDVLLSLISLTSSNRNSVKQR
jgi:hypothetical protein